METAGPGLVSSQCQSRIEIRPAREVHLPVPRLWQQHVVVPYLYVALMLPQVLGVVDDPRPGEIVCQRIRDGPCAILTSIVDDEELEGGSKRVERVPYLPGHRFDIGFFIVRKNHNRNAHCLPRYLPRSRLPGSLTSWIAANQIKLQDIV